MSALSDSDEPARPVPSPCDSSPADPEHPTVVATPHGGTPAEPGTVTVQLVADRYRTLGLVGSGGTGTVYRAHDHELDEIVALKVLRRELVGSEGAFEHVEAAVEAGLMDLGWLEHCPALGPLRGEARFEAAVARVAERTASARALLARGATPVASAGRGGAPAPAQRAHSTITRSLAPRPKVSGSYISSALGGGTTKRPGVVARAAYTYS